MIAAVTLPGAEVGNVEGDADGEADKYRGFFPATPLIVKANPTSFVKTFIVGSPRIHETEVIEWEVLSRVSWVRITNLVSLDVGHRVSNKQ